MSMSRRAFLRNGGCAALGASAFVSSLSRLGAVSAHAAELPASDYRALVCVFLFGGNDSWNTVVNLDEYAAYASARGALALPQAALRPIQPSNDARRFGLHPSLAEFESLFASGKLAVLNNVGALVAPITRAEYLAHPELRPANLFSHSDQIFQWQSGGSAPALPTGWGGRVGDHTLELNGADAFPMIVSLAGAPLFGTGTSVRPLELTSSGSIPLAGFSSSSTSQTRYAAMLQLLTLGAKRPFVGAAGATLARAIDGDRRLANALASAPALQTVFPASGLADQLKLVARCLSVREALGVQRQIFFVSLGGFDTHANQLATQAALLTQLSQALGAFQAATEELGLGAQVTTFTHSDFSRTYRSNGSGSDHAWGGCHFILGGSVRGGALYGQWPTLALAGPDDSGSSGRFIPTTAVDQYTATLARWYGLAPSDLPVVFPNLGRFGSADLGFMV
jgi:uncharacterized protein (DUF1501 family)